MEQKSRQTVQCFGLHLNTRVVLMMILLFALLASLYVAATADIKLENDQIDYHNLAVGLIRHGSFDSISRAPVYPFFVAAVYAVAGPHPSAVVFVQALILVLTLFLAHRIFLKVTKRQDISLLATALCALWPQFYSQVPLILTENLSGLLLAVTIWCALWARESQTARSAVASGVATAVLTLAKAVTLPAVVLIPVLLAFGPAENRRQRLVSAGASLLAGLVLISAWTYRNYRVTDRFLPVTTLGGFNCVYGNSPQTYETSLTQTDELLRSMNLYYVASTDARAVEIDQERMQRGLSIITSHPVRSLGLFARKFSGLWLGTLGQDPKVVPHRPHIGSFGIPYMAFAYVPLFLLAVLGWFALPRESRSKTGPILILALVWTGAYVLLYGERRYMVPMLYYEFLFASAAIVWVWQRAFRKIQLQ